jgi:hypothetical protein
MWKKLQSIYERESDVSVHLLYQWLYSLKFEEHLFDSSKQPSGYSWTKGKGTPQENGNDQAHYDSPWRL